MAYNAKLAERIRASVADIPNVEEKFMFGGVCFMLNGKMCVGIVKDEMMCRIGPEAYEEALGKRGCSEMIFTGKPMKGYVYVSEEGMGSESEFDYWIQLSLRYNKVAKATKKKT